jgi:hypothetical protein
MSMDGALAETSTSRRYIMSTSLALHLNDQEYLGFAYHGTVITLASSRSCTKLVGSKRGETERKR